MPSQNHKDIWRISYVSMPAKVHVWCDSCRSRATFTTAFTYTAGKIEDAPPPQKPNARRVQWGNGFIEEKYPREFPWRDQDNPFKKTTSSAVVGILQCERCTARKKHILKWPSDAFYKIESRAGSLWAWNRDFLVAARNYIASETRDKSAHGYSSYRYLRALPKEFLQTKNRAVLTKLFDRKLTKTDFG